MLSGRARSQFLIPCRSGIMHSRRLMAGVPHRLICIMQANLAHSGRSFRRQVGRLLMRKYLTGHPFAIKPTFRLEKTRVAVTLFSVADRWIIHLRFYQNRRQFEYTWLRFVARPPTTSSDAYLHAMWTKLKRMISFYWTAFKMRFVTERRPHT